MWGDTAGRRRTRVVEDEVRQLAIANIFANIVGGDDGHPIALVYRNTRAVDSRAQSSVSQFINPGAQVRVVIFGKPAAFFDIQKNNRA